MSYIVRVSSRSAIRAFMVILKSRKYVLCMIARCGGDEELLNFKCAHIPPQITLNVACNLRHVTSCAIT